MDLFTHTDPKTQKTRERDACEVAGGTVADLVAMVERMAIERRSVNQILAAVRAFSATQAANVAPDSVWLSCTSPEWRAWTAYRGKSPPQDKRGGWWFPSRWPPATREIDRRAS